jgi:phospholipase/carboxylesterase
VRTAAPILDAFIDSQLAHYGLTDDKLVLVGFSQGTMMSLHVAPRRQKTMAGVIGYSGRLIDPAALATEAVSKPKILLVHGEADPMVPVSSIYEARDALMAAGFEVGGYISPGLGHSIDQPGLQLGGDFLNTVLLAD